MMKPRNYATKHVSDPHVDDVTNHEDGTCTFHLDTIPDKGVRTINVYKDGLIVFSISVGEESVAYQTMLYGRDLNLYTLWDDEV